MIALLSLLGLGVLASVFLGGDDDDGQANSSGDDTREETFTQGMDVVLDQSYLGAVEADAADLVAEGELTQTEANAALDAVEFRTGAVNIRTGGGDDYVATGRFDDTISTGSGDDFAIGGEGDDRIELGAGNDVYGVDTRTIETADDFVSFPDGNFEIFGTPSELEGGNDTILGGSGIDAISDSFGSNFVNGQQGSDFISVVDEEDDNVATPDRVLGGFGNDTIYADEGDQITGNQGRDQITVDIARGVSEGYDLVTVTDFQRGIDRLELEGSLALLGTPAPSGSDDAPVNPISVVDLEDGSGAVVSVNGIQVVRVLGGAGMTVADVGLST